MVIRVQVHRLVAAPVDLPPAGQALRDGEAASLPGIVLLDEPGHLRPGTDQAHLTPQHVNHLWELIQAEASQKPADASNTRVVFALVQQMAVLVGCEHILTMLLSVGDHRPELEHVEAPSVLSHSPLAKDGRTPGIESDG